MLSRLATRFVVFACIAACGPAALATAVYSTTAESVFAFTVPVISSFPSPVVTVSTNSDFGAILTGGNGIATNSGSPSGSTARPVRTMVSAGGSAFAPPYSFAQSSRLSGHLIRIDNSAGLDAVSVVPSPKSQ